MNSCCTARETTGRAKGPPPGGQTNSVKDSLPSGPFLLHLWIQPTGKQNIQKPNITL